MIKRIKKQTNSLKKQKGFTLVEIMVAIFIFVMIMLALSTFQRDIFFFGSNLQSNLSAQIEARRVLKTFVSEMRGASPSSLGSYPIESVASSSIVFFSDLDNDNIKERIRYYLDGDKIKRGVIKPSLNPVSYSGSENTSTVVRDVVNGALTPVFEYYSGGYISTSTAPLSDPIDIAQIRYVKFHVEIDSDPNRSPEPVISETGVTLRNLKDNL